MNAALDQVIDEINQYRRNINKWTNKKIYGTRKTSYARYGRR
jgi:hypothetical protein